MIFENHGIHHILHAIGLSMSPVVLPGNLFFAFHALVWVLRANIQMILFILFQDYLLAAPAVVFFLHTTVRM
jgi:hypothetical protein